MSDHLDEIGGELDRVLRSATMAASQIAENIARRVANTRQTQAAAARAAFIEQRDQARALYLPLTYGKAGDRATPQQLREAAHAASAWAGRDPEAARAAAQLWDRLPAIPGEPRSEGSVQATPTLAPPAAPVASPGDAIALAQQNAPGYYTRHAPERSEQNAEQLVTDWSHWQQHGELPQQSVRQEWARHVGRAEEADQARDAAGPGAYDAALEHIWQTSGAFSDDEAVTLAGEHAPAYYTRHHRDVLAVDPDTEQLRADWAHWREHGELPLTSRQEEWAAYVGRQAEFNPDQWDTTDDRDTALHHVWDEGRDERGLLEMTDHLDRMDDAGMDSGQVLDSTLAQDIEQFRLDRDTARDTYTPLLDPATFNDADQATVVAAWQQAAGWSGQDPAAQTAAEQLDREFRSRWGTSPMDYLLDQVGDARAAQIGIDRAAVARAAAADELAQAAGLDQAHDQDTSAADTAMDPAARQQHYVDAARATAGADVLRADAADIAPGDEATTPRYDRAAESDLDAPGVTDAARQARIESAPVFSRSLRDSLNQHTPGSGKNASVSKTVRNRSLAAEHDLGR